MGGSKENRHTPGVDHWSIAIKDGKVLEKEWRTETPIPRGGPHRLVTSVGLTVFTVCFSYSSVERRHQKLFHCLHCFHAGLVLLLMIS